MVLGIFDHAFYINCDHRKDRRLFFETQAKQINMQVERFSAIIPKDKGKFGTLGIRGCGESHLALWKLARERKYKYTLFLEDDAAFTYEGISALHEFANELAIKNWDMFYLQVKRRRVRNCEDLNRGIHQVSASILTHAYAVRDSALDFLIEKQQRNDSLPIDLYLHDFIHSSLKVCGIGPAVAFQLYSKSDVCENPRPSNLPVGCTPVLTDRI